MLDEPSESSASRDPETVTMRGVERAPGDDMAGTETASGAAAQAGSTTASFILARLLAEQKDGRGTVAAFQRAVRRGHVAPGFSLGALLAESDDARGLITAYRVAAEHGDAGAGYQLGLLYLDRGDLDSARSVFASADKLGHPWAALGLGEILEQTGNRSGAIAAYRRASDRRVTAAHARLDALLKENLETDELVIAPRPADAAAVAGSARQRFSRRRVARTAGAAAALAAFLIAILTLLPSGHTGPARTAPSAGTPQRHRQTTSGTRPASQSPAKGFTVPQAALLDSVPRAAHARCLPGAEEPLPRSDASIRCYSAGAGVTALYYRYSSLQLLRSVFHNYRAWFASHLKLRDCAGRTHGKYFQGGASTIAGRWACFYNDRTNPESACIDWADYRLLIFGSACQGDGDFTALARWWAHAGPVPASAPGLSNRY